MSSELFFLDQSSVPVEDLDATFDPDADRIEPPYGYRRSECYFVRRADNSKAWIPY